MQATKVLATHVVATGVAREARERAREVASALTKNYYFGHAFMPLYKTLDYYLKAHTHTHTSIGTVPIHTPLYICNNTMSASSGLIILFATHC